MNSAAMNIEALWQRMFSFLMDIYLRVELLSHMVARYLIF